MLRAVLDRNPSGATVELSSMQLVLRAPPPKASDSPWRSFADDSQRRGTPLTEVRIWCSALGRWRKM